VISVSIMHGRREMHPLLLPRLKGAKVSVIDGKGLTLWECAETAWRAVRGDYHLVMHDDMKPCLGFIDHVQRIVTNHRQPFSFWGSRTEEVMPKAGGFLSYATFCWGGALGMPAYLAPQFLDWCAAKIEPDWLADDTRLALWCAATGRRLLVPYPNLVQHAAVKSIARPGRKNQRSPSFVEDLGRIFWGGPVVEVPGDPEAFLISRSMHTKEEGAGWWR